MSTDMTSDTTGEPGHGHDVAETDDWHGRTA
jgi:hypothetical protein